MAEYDVAEYLWGRGSLLEREFREIDRKGKGHNRKDGEMMRG